MELNRIQQLSLWQRCTVCSVQNQSANVHASYVNSGSCSDELLEPCEGKGGDFRVWSRFGESCPWQLAQ